MQGLRIGVTGSRKGEELAAALERREAVPLLGPTLQVVPPDGDARLLADTDAVVAAAPAWFAASTGAGMRAWVDAADAHGRGDDLRRVLRQATCVARGPKAVGGLRYAGADAAHVSPQETDADLAGWLRGQLARGDVLGVQLHGEPEADPYRALGDAGVGVRSVAPLRCGLPDDAEPARRLVKSACNGELDVVVCTSRPAVRGLFDIARAMGGDDDLRAAFADGVAAAAVGPVTAAALEAAGVAVSMMPTRFRTGELLRVLEEWPARRAQIGSSRPIRLTPDGRVARCDHRAVRLGAREFGVLAALVRRPGIVCPPALLAREAWGHVARNDAAVVKHHISRLRRKLGAAGAALTTVRGVGYRFDP